MTRSFYLTKHLTRIALAAAVATGGVLTVSAPAHATVGNWERLSSYGTGLVVGVPSPWTTNDLQVETVTYGVNVWNGQWKLTSVGVDTFTVENRYSRQCLDTENGNSTTAGTPVVQRPCDGTTSQRWVRTADAVLPVWHFANAFSGLSLAVESGANSVGIGFVQATNAPNNTKQMFQEW